MFLELVRVLVVNVNVSSVKVSIYKKFRSSRAIEGFNSKLIY